jgi:hypothetical protein
MKTTLVCTPRFLPMHMQVRAAQRATELNPHNQPCSVAVFRALGPRPPQERIALLVSRRWSPKGVKLAVGFLDNAASDLRARILLHMNAWAKTANVQFVESRTDPQVRIARVDDAPEMSGFWSFLGTDILDIGPGEPTMNLEGFTMETPESEFYRVVRHETGHTLGFSHEHMRRELVQRIDPEKAISFFGRTQNWTPQEVRAQVLTPLEESSLLGTPHADQQSIMCYQIPGFLTIDGQPILGGLDIDASDFALAGSVYPKQFDATGPTHPVPLSKPNGCCGEYRTGYELGHGMISGDTFEDKLVTYAKIDGVAIFEGDIVLDGRLKPLPGPGAERAERPEPSVQIVQQDGNVERAIVITGAGFRWSNGVIPFEIDGMLPAAQQTAANNAIAHWRSRTRLAFVQRTAQNQAQLTLSLLRLEIARHRPAQLAAGIERTDPPLAVNRIVEHNRRSGRSCETVYLPLFSSAVDLKVGGTSNSPSSNRTRRQPPPQPSLRGPIAQNRHETLAIR